MPATRWRCFFEGEDQGREGGCGIQGYTDKVKNNPMIIPISILICAIIMVTVFSYFFVRAVHREHAYKAELLKVQKDQIRMNGILIDSMERCLSKLNERDK